MFQWGLALTPASTGDILSAVRSLTMLVPDARTLGAVDAMAAEAACLVGKLPAGVTEDADRLFRELENRRREILDQSQRARQHFEQARQHFEQARQHFEQARQPR